MERKDRFVLTDLPSDDSDAVVTNRMRRCRGCASCISTDPGECSIDDELTPVIADILSRDTLEIRTGVESSQFSMPMRKAVERLGNVLQSYTDAGGNTPLDKGSVRLRHVEIVSRDPVDGAFERAARELLLNGPVDTIAFKN